MRRRIHDVSESEYREEDEVLARERWRLLGCCCQQEHCLAIVSPLAVMPACRSALLYSALLVKLLMRRPQAWPDGWGELGQL
ncbi:hypothetical protein Cob_v011151 [Colletotrichum orbiculare MAFF 240422]|uniref:Uncharacterized protein n=1 Tax=Colletotrichum orbiculare (strain 104-T / ATCC 96160 / CBS 514.97 / LARS 414 / MAFF 240422) TaxID=1213857 RepID=A0A484FE11_COLOR|nr:hypothetical protein Cob_v011151 [Colletotrichum orbiculare MAFF 240422]